MRKPFLKVALIPAVLLLAFASGCNLVESPSTANLAKDASIVLQEEFCVTFDCVVTSTDFAVEVVAQEFSDEIEAWLNANGVGTDSPGFNEICDIFQSGGRIVLNEPYNGHEWDFTSRVDVRWTHRDGMEWYTYLRTQTVTIPNDIAAPGYTPSFSFRGVRSINRALKDLVQGRQPTLEVRLQMTDIDPEPSEMDPLVFSWDACVNVVVVAAPPPGCGKGK